ncbi:MAG: hypothetical protein Q9180_005751 [Flavoplaca navasiana]
MSGLQMNFTGRQLTEEESKILDIRPSVVREPFGITGRSDWFHVENVNDPNAQVLNSTMYFEDLVSRFTSAESLPRVFRGGVESKSVPLFGLDADGRVSLPKDTVSGEGFALALQVLPKMVYYNLSVRLQQEMSLILESKTTDDTQMARVRSLLNQYAKLQRYQYGFGNDSTHLARLAFDATVRRSRGAVDVASQPREASHDLENVTPPLSDRDESTRRDREERTERIRQEPIVRFPEESTGSDPEELPYVSGMTKRDYLRSERRERLARKFGMRNRFVAAVLGGLSLIAPMLIMAIKPSQVKTLCTSSVAVLLFSLGLAWKSSARTETLFATTATYAAVMVVFVGVNSNN